MKKLFMSFLILSLASSIWADSHTYKIIDGISVTFTPIKKVIIVSTYFRSLDVCLEEGEPSYPGDDGCESYGRIGDRLAYQLQIGTYVIKDANAILAEYPLVIWVESEKRYNERWNQQFTVSNGFTSFGIPSRKLFVSYDNKNLSKEKFEELIPKSALRLEGNFNELNESFLNKLFEGIFKTQELKIDINWQTYIAYKI